FGALHREDPVRISRYISRITRSFSTYAYAVRHTIFDAFVASNERANGPVDWNNFALQEKYNCYCFMPHLAWVETRYSNVQERLGDHWYLRESVVAFGAGMERILGRTLVIIAYNNREKTEAHERNLKFLTRFYNQKLK